VKPIRALVFGLGIAAVAAVPALASTGVSIDVARIAVSEDLLPGNEYRLPTFGVRNPGTESTTYRLTISYIADQGTLQPPESWFEFGPTELTLGPDESRSVQTQLRIPPDAEPGSYSALIGPQIAAQGGGAQIGAAAAAKLSFTVVPSSQLDAWLRMLSSFLADNPWLLVLPATAVLMGAWWVLRRRFSISIARRP
jgi:hypothetical protein